MPLADVKKITISFTLDAEQIPGTFYDPQEFAEHVAALAQTTLRSYDPRCFVTRVESVSKLADDLNRMDAAAGERDGSLFGIDIMGNTIGEVGKYKVLYSPTGNLDLTLTHTGTLLLAFQKPNGQRETAEYNLGTGTWS